MVSSIIDPNAGLSRLGLKSILISTLELYHAQQCSTADCKEITRFILRLMISHRRSVGGRKFLCYWSQGASSKHPSTEGTEVDHTVPIAYITEKMLEEKDPYVAMIEMEPAFHLVRLLPEEHKELLTCTMPLNWNPNDGESWQARYKAANIIISAKETEGDLEYI